MISSKQSFSNALRKCEKFSYTVLDMPELINKRIHTSTTKIKLPENLQKRKMELAEFHARTSIRKLFGLSLCFVFFLGPYPKEVIYMLVWENK